EIEEINGLMTQAAGHFNQKNYTDAGVVVKEVQARIAKVAEGADQATMGQLAAIHKRLEIAHDKLKSEGVDLPPLASLPGAKSTAKAAVKPVMEKPAPEKTAAKT